MSRYVLTPENYDGVVSALVGNGELCTTLGPTGFHTPPEQQTDIAHKTQHFVLSGRRKAGHQHPLINFGTLTMRVYVDGEQVAPESYDQEVLDESDDLTVSDGVFSVAYWPRKVTTSAYCFVLPQENRFVVHGGFECQSKRPADVLLEFEYIFGDPQAELTKVADSQRVEIKYRFDNEVGEIELSCVAADVLHEVKTIDRGGLVALQLLAEPDAAESFTLLLSFSDRVSFEYPFALETADDRKYADKWLAGLNKGNWNRFQAVSDVVTSDQEVDRFRLMSLYTLRCQATPWSIPPTVSEEYWGAGTFHDEMYPFLGLLTSNHVELAERVPYFRLSTLPQAVQRARGRGALYPWSSTEYGEERDPNGLWLTERFHLGQFAVCIWMLWLYNRDKVQLDDLYPVLKEVARYYEMNMLERDDNGRLRTKACVDFDESVGEVTNGPFTICAAIASLEYAANAAEILERDSMRVPRWRALASELRDNLPAKDDRFDIPDGKPLHYSILGPIFPFRIDVDGPRAGASAEHIHKVCRSTKGWKPGFSEVFEGSNWMWTAAHLGIVHALHGNGDLAWEAIKEAPASAGPFLSPNEHVDKDGVIHVPWFTTGCGAWLYALNCLFVQVDEDGTKLLPAVPRDLKDFHFKGLRAEFGVLVSGRFVDGKLTELTACPRGAQKWRFRVPLNISEQARFLGTQLKEQHGFAAFEIDLVSAEAASLITRD